MTSPLLLPYGLRVADHRMVSPDDVENGLACGCICPNCKRRLVAKQGEVLTHHFAHEAEADCLGAQESMVHALSKQMVVDALHICTPPITINGYCWHETIRQPLALDIVNTEVSSEGIRPDILAFYDGMPLAIEVAVTHFCDDHKIALLRRRRLPAIEIDLSDYGRDMSAAEIRGSVLLYAPRRWLFNPDIDDLIAAHRAEIEEQARQLRQFTVLQRGVIQQLRPLVQRLRELQWAECAREQRILTARLERERREEQERRQRQEEVRRQLQRAQFWERQDAEINKLRDIEYERRRGNPNGSRKAVYTSQRADIHHR